MKNDREIFQLLVNLFTLALHTSNGVKKPKARILQISRSFWCSNCVFMWEQLGENCDILTYPH